MFNQIGVLSYESGDEDTLMEAALDAGAEDVVVAEDDGSIEVLTDIASFTAVNLALTEAGLSPDEAEVTMRADNLIPLDVANAEKLLKLVDVLEELDDVQEVFTNADIPDEVIQAIDSA
jgi:transcriptional/translational regulatory protein YebC/TACO1